MSQKVAVRTRSIPRRSFTPELLRSLHALADRMLSEDIEHFRLHAKTNEVVHVYERTDTGAPVGFQFWRTAAMDLRDCRVVIGGKLRIEPEFRRRALHLRSCMRFYLENQLRHPGTRFYFLAVASLFGFVSIASALADYRLFDPSASDAEGRAIRGAFEAQAAQSHHRLDEADRPVRGRYHDHRADSRAVLSRVLRSPRSTRVHPRQSGLARQWLQCRVLVSLHAGEPGHARVDDRTQAMTVVWRRAERAGPACSI